MVVVAVLDSNSGYDNVITSDNLNRLMRDLLRRDRIWGVVMFGSVVREGRLVVYSKLRHLELLLLGALKRPR